jgi:hypothetical protein
VNEPLPFPIKENKGGAFKPGFDPRRGKVPPPRKKPGAKALITRDLKQGIMDAAELYGSDGKGTGGLTGYLFLLAGKHPKAFAGLLGKVLPMTVSAAHQVSPVAINIIAVPHDQYLSPADIARLSGPPALEPVEVEAESQGASVTDITEEPEE